jgi:hypothetical protein
MCAAVSSALLNQNTCELAYIQWQAALIEALSILATNHVAPGRAAELRGRLERAPTPDALICAAESRESGLGAKPAPSPDDSLLAMVLAAAV